MKSSRFFAYLQLMRPANLVTAMADILAGVSITVGAYGITNEGLAISGFPPICYLLLSTIGLYGGGVVFNDVFDAELDAVERSERPIPSGRASIKGAIILGIILMLIGTLAAFQVAVPSGCVAIAIAFFAILYNKIGKHKAWGPLNMGICRALNLVLGMSIVTNMSIVTFLRVTHFFIPLPNSEPFLLSALSILNAKLTPLHILCIPLLYIYAITSISRGEVHGHSRKAFILPFVLYVLVVILLLGIYPPPTYTTSYWERLPFLVFWILLILPPLLKAYHNPQPKNIGLAVKAGVISLIALDAIITAAFTGWADGLFVLALLPVSRLLARFFAVT